MRARFELDLGKARSNRRNELRWKTVGIVEGFLLLVVAHTVVDDEGDGEVIRIISARHAGSKERKSYEENCAL